MHNIFSRFNRFVIMLAFLLVFSGSMAAPVAEEFVERIYPIPEHGILVMRVPAEWQELVAQPNATVPPTITFSPILTDRFTYVMTPLWSVPGSPKDFGTPDHIKALVQSTADKAAGTALEKTITIHELTGPNTGYYFVATHKNPKQGGYKYLTQGAARVGTLVVSFTLLTKKEDPAFIQQALTLLRKASQETMPAVDQGLALTKDGKIQIHATKAPWFVRFNQSNLVVRQQRLMDDGKTRYYHFVSRDTRLSVSVFIEPATTCKTSNACRALQLSGENMKGAVDVKEYDSGEFSILEYRLEEIKGTAINQYKINAHFVKDGYWLDLQLSQDGSSEVDRELFKNFLADVEVVRVKAPSKK